MGPQTKQTETMIYLIAGFCAGVTLTLALSFAFVASRADERMASQTKQRPRAMTWKEIQELREAGFEVTNPEDLTK